MAKVLIPSIVGSHRATAINVQKLDGIIAPAKLVNVFIPVVVSKLGWLNGNQVLNLACVLVE